MKPRCRTKHEYGTFIGSMCRKCGYRPLTNTQYLAILEREKLRRENEPKELLRIQELEETLFGVRP